MISPSHIGNLWQNSGVLAGPALDLLQADRELNGLVEWATSTYRILIYLNTSKKKKSNMVGSTVILRVTRKNTE